MTEPMVMDFSTASEKMNRMARPIIDMAEKVGIPKGQIELAISDAITDALLMAERGEITALYSPSTDRIVFSGEDIEKLMPKNVSERERAIAATLAALVRLEECAKKLMEVKD